MEPLICPTAFDGVPFFVQQVVHLSKELTEHCRMTVPLPSGTLCPVIGSQCVLSAGSPEGVMRTLVGIAFL